METLIRHLIGEGSTDDLIAGKRIIWSPGVQGSDTSTRDYQGTVEILMYLRRSSIDLSVTLNIKR
ncbi:hypothetical protein BVY01_02515 [bacterium I07]|nr:hypothetical protein BVY01_02515 [bacterium I07]